MSNISDEKMIKAAMEDDTEAVETLKDRIKSVSQSAIEMQRIQGSAEHVAVLVGEIEQKVLNALHQFRFRVPFQTWVYRITVNMILEYQRSIITHKPISQNLNGSISKT